MEYCENIPDSIKSLPIFNCWRYVIKPGATKPTKVPYSPKSLGFIKNAQVPQGMDKRNPALYTPFDEAVQALRETQKAALIQGTVAFDGVGMGIFPKVGFPSAIDIDHCLVNGKLDSVAADIVETMNSYTEVSPSGTGLHILFFSDTYQHDKGAFKLRTQIGKNQNGEIIGLELYTGEPVWYMTFTGNIYCNADVEERGQQARAIAEKYMRREERETETPESREPVSPPMDDDKLIQILLNAANAERAQSLWNGDISGNDDDHSAADLALMNLLTFYTQDPEQLDRIFRKSGLNR